MRSGFPTTPLVADATNIPYTPAVPGNWSPVPTNLADAEDQAIARIVALESVPGAVAQVYICLAGDAVLQLMYRSAAGTVAKADASNPAKMPALGFIASKPTTTTCAVQTGYELSGFVGLTPDAVYYADPATPGGITTTQPTTVGQVAQQVGVAKSTTVLTVTIGTAPPIYL